MAVKELSGSPGLAGLYPRAVIKSLPLVGGGGKGLPDTELVLPELEIERDHLMRYDRVCGIEFGDELPATYPHILAFPLAMQLMTDRSFPLPVIGMVHIENEITQTRPLKLQERPTLRVRAADLRPHDKGTQFDIVSEASVGDEQVWRERRTYLRRGGGDGSKGKKERPEPPKADDFWDVPGDIGRRYAAVSGDRNPIHMHAVPARLLGMPGMIAHGMWVLARCLAALKEPAPSELKASFKAPLVIPARVQFAKWGQGEFAVHDADSGKPHLVGRLA
jgi:acyl dehydratase